MNRRNDYTQPTQPDCFKTDMNSVNLSLKYHIAVINVFESLEILHTENLHNHRSLSTVHASTVNTVIFSFLNDWFLVSSDCNCNMILINLTKLIICKWHQQVIWVQFSHLFGQYLCNIQDVYIKCVPLTATSAPWQFKNISPKQSVHKYGECG